MRPATLLAQWRWRWQWRCSPFSVLFDSTASSLICMPFATARSTHHRNVHYVSRGFKLPYFQIPSYLEEGENNNSDDDDDDDSSDLDSGKKKSRNQKKREARRAVRWGMELASFSPPQIKRVLRVASLEREVYDALMLVKRLGPDVREGKRRQYNYIGKLLREVEPELMDSLIHATKDGDWSRIEGLSVSDTEIIGEDDHETDYEVEDEV
uniref:Uncharacterized protein MANES_05G146300 n=1 Tax=Rhizophora mucronata TaxID=61149 RepID=A0A2P2JUF3_RHIMU